MKMFCFATFCYACFSTEHLQPTDTLDFDNISFLDKIVFFIPNENVDLDIPKYICLPCCSALRISYRFQMMLAKSHKQIKGYLAQMQNNNVTKQSALKIKLVDFKRQAIRNKRKIQINNKTNETVNSIKPKYAKSDPVLNETKEKIVNEKNDGYEIFIKEESALENRNKTVLGFSNKELSCNICDSKKNTPEHREDLPKNKADNKFICSICSKSYTKINEFNYHMLFHDSSNLFKCKLCDKSFTTKDRLKRHRTVLHIKGGK